MRRMKIPLSWQMVLTAIVAVIIGNVWPIIADTAASFTVLFIRAMELLVVPYVFFAIGSAISKMSEQEFLGRMLLKNMALFVTMELLAIVTALLVANIVFINSTITMPSLPTLNIDSTVNYGDFIFDMIPKNLIQIASSPYLPSVVLIACIFGYYVNECGDRSRIFLNNLMLSSGDVMQRITNLVAQLSPVGVFCVFSQLTIENTIFDNLYKVEPLIIALFVALTVHSLLSTPIILKVFAYCNPYRLFKQFASVLIVSGSYSSPTLAVPMATNKLKQETGVASHIADFSMPIISTINFNGTSIFLAVTALYVAHTYGIDLSILEQLILIFAVSFITIGCVNTPLTLSAIIIPILDSMGIPSEGIAIALICNTLFGMICPVVDTWCNVAITTIIASAEGDKIKTEPSI